MIIERFFDVIVLMLFFCTAITEGTKVSRLEQLLSKILRRKPGTSPSRHLKLIKFTIVAVIAVVVNYFLAKS